MHLRESKLRCALSAFKEGGDWSLKREKMGTPLSVPAPITVSYFI